MSLIADRDWSKHLRESELSNDRKTQAKLLLESLVVVYWSMFLYLITMDSSITSLYRALR